MRSVPLMSADNIKILTVLAWQCDRHCALFRVVPPVVELRVCLSAVYTHFGLQLRAGYFLSDFDQIRVFSTYLCRSSQY